MDNLNDYKPDTTTGALQGNAQGGIQGNAGSWWIPLPNTCPNCGRCPGCGRPYVAPVYYGSPIWHYSPYTQPTFY
jgi:hypothetical protein